MKVALYARVSLEEGDKNDRRYQEPENQLEPLRNWANTMGWQVVSEYVDRGSGADPGRPNFRRMMSDAMQMRFNSVLVWKLDRFSREGISNTLAYIEKIRGRNVALKSMTESWLDTSKDNPISEVILAIMSWVAAEERRKISERTKLGIQRRKNLGIWKGGRPMKNATLEQQKEILSLAAKGKGTTDIMRKTGIAKKTIELLIKGSPPSLPEANGSN